ncbi:MAG: cold shock domain-containing protein [Burkholderiaceae bacterium]|nr:cold shock domain-containing protein [Burkholderiaceae bacterium]
METGTVKSYNKEKGFGVIVSDQGAETFVHQASVLV